MSKKSTASTLVIWVLVILSIFGPLAMFLYWIDQRRIKFILKTRGAYPRYQ